MSRIMFPFLTKRLGGDIRLKRKMHKNEPPERESPITVLDHELRYNGCPCSSNFTDSIGKT